MNLVERLRSEVKENGRVSLVLRRGNEISGHILSHTDKGIFFEEFIPYEQIVDYTLLTEAPTNRPEAVEDPAGPKKDETIALRRKNGTFLTGRYIEEDAATIHVETENNGAVIVEKADIDCLFLCGIITTYNILNKSGVVNNRYRFNKGMVDTSSSIFKRLDKDDPREKNMYICLYRLEKKRGQESSIAALDDFDDIKEEIRWKEGEITSVPERSSYFTVGKDARCYYSIVDDETLLQYRREDNLQGQKVIYREVYHRICDEKRKPNVPSSSVIDIRSGYQIGRVKRNLLTNAITIQCGRYRYRYRGEKDLPEGIFVVAKIDVDEDGRECVTSTVSQDEKRENLNLPTLNKKNDLQKKRDGLEREQMSAEKRKNYQEQFDKIQELFDENLWSPEDSFTGMLKATLNIRRMKDDGEALDRMEGVLRDDGYRLPGNLIHVFQMQISYLQGDFEEARKQANQILQSSNQYRGEILLQAKGVKSGIGEFPVDELEQWIIRSGQNGLVGTIDTFDANTNIGRISVDTQQYLFNWRDVKVTRTDEGADIGDKQFDFRRNRYIVSFSLDTESEPNGDGDGRAVRVELQDVCPLRGMEARESFMGDDFDAELETINNLPKNKLLEHMLEQFSLEDIKEFLSTREREKICNGDYKGITTTRVKLVKALDELHDKDVWDEEYFSKAVPKGEKSRLLLARAKLISQYLKSRKDTVPPEELKEDKMKRALYEYAYDYVMDHFMDKNETTSGTMAYYAESILSAPGLKMDSKLEVAEKCMERYYREGKLHDNCNDVDGLVRMMLSFPEPVFDEISDDPKYEKVILDLGEGVPKIKELFGDTKKKQVQSFYDAWNKTKKSLERKLMRTENLRRDVTDYLNWVKEMEDGFVEYLFEEEEEIIRELKDQFWDFIQNTDDESPLIKSKEIPEIYRKCRELLDGINEKPTKFSYEVLYPFIEAMCDNIATYLEKLYQDNEPVISVEHHSLIENRSKEVLCLINAEGKLRAKEIHISVSSLEGKPMFETDLKYKADPGEAIEILIPLEGIREEAQQVGLRAHILYERLVYFDREGGEGIYESIKKPLEMEILIPFAEDILECIPKNKNPYSRYAGGKAMGPMDKAMFFGRDGIIDAIFRDIMREDGVSVDAGKMTAFYGQKRSGKTSIMNFLKERIEQANPRAIVLTVNAQDFLLEDNKPNLFIQKMMAAIFKDLKKTMLNPKYKELREILKREQLEIPSPRELVDNPRAEVTFMDFFAQFNEGVAGEYPIVIMVDEFTQVYVNLKENKIDKNFLHHWRALVTEIKCSCVLVGQDFMEKFYEDPTIANSTNGLATTSMHAIGYLSREDAYRMMEKPILRQDGSSRFHGKLGEKAKERIFNLTGGSAFYLMKFMNGLVDYMIENRNDLVTPGLVEKVVDKHVFVTQNNPIEKKDFDPIYNEYSSSLVLREKPKVSDTLQGQEEVAKRVYKFFKEIARSMEDGVCRASDIQWEDLRERNEIIRTLRDRRILVDSNGNDIVGKELKGLTFRVKVGLFIEFLKRRVLNQED